MSIHFKQRTLAKAVNCSGVGLHSGLKTNLSIRPAPVNHGIKFIRADLLDCPSISAHFNRVVDTSLATVIGFEGFIVSTIEHLMASFAGLSIDNALVELDAYEVPVMDGSAGPFTRLIRSAGIQEQIAPRHFFVIQEPIEFCQNGKFVGLYPGDSYKITCRIEFDHPLIRKQKYTLAVSDRIFESEISWARTFGFLQDLEQMRRYGLARGGSLDNAVVIAQDSIVNSDGLRYPDEFVRHKLLDCLGDFSLLGMPILGHIMVDRSGHAFNHAFLKLFFERRDSWETRAIDNLAELSPWQSKDLAI
jgi:UDP-3-O-[3-hydroxymyristoyl] N-acetylglucosamine deacetylase